MIYSCEEAQAKLADLTEEQAENPSAFGALANFRLRVLPVLGTMPALVGIGAAAWVLSELGQKPFVPQRAEPVSQKIAHRLHNKLVQRETQVYGNDHAASPIADQNEVSHVLEDVWGLRSAFSGSRNLSHLMTLTRFDRSKPALPYNLVVVTEPEAEWLEAETAATGSLPRALMGDGTSDAGSPSKVAPALETLLAIGDTLGRLEAVWTAEEVRSQTERKARLAKFNSARRK